MTEKNIVLIGFMGTGKSTVGKLLAKKIGREWIDVDHWIEQKTKRKIADIFESDGESAFRRMEKDAILEMASKNRCVITTGGGAVLDPANMLALRKNGILVVLEASPETIYERVKDARHRPLLKNSNPKDEIARLLKERKPHYEKADLSIRTDGKAPGRVAEEIMAMLEADPAGEFGKDWF